MSRLPRFLVALLVFSGGVVLLLTAYLFLQSQRGGVSYEVRGRVVGFGDDSVTVFIEHEAIPDFMPAMTMPFVAERPALLDGLAYGDAVAVTRRDRCQVVLVLRDLECSPPDAARAEYRERRFVHRFVIRCVRREVP